MEEKEFSVNVPVEYYRRFRLLEQSKGISLRAAVCEAIEAYGEICGDSRVSAMMAKIPLVVFKGPRQEIKAGISVFHHNTLRRLTKLRHIAETRVAFCEAIDAYLKREGQTPVTPFASTERVTSRVFPAFG